MASAVLARTRSPETPEGVKPLSPGRRIVRAAAGAALIALSVLLVIGQQAFRIGEATVMTALVKPFLGDGVFAFRDQVVIRQTPSHYLGLQITAECTALMVLIPVLVLSATLITVLARLQWSRWLIGVAVAAGMILVINFARIGMITAATITWGQAGFDWTHAVFGTVFMLSGSVATLFVMFRIMIGPFKRKARTAVAEETPGALTDED
ncbi:archaeosortase/exosortase family protein [Leifsonia shinshuensis]|uniref:archaeosortase/exosortase family protein n=1 Tax=Leifsonia shinshuensis TaxID=150026 RepID=UPI002854B598|nr:archaeosortase/exosortase family protein [Leifsonia shinshuensis]MDR6972105.1 exosortase/archaeosortase family protein [Leifsonia shinshuensis]